MSQPPILNTFGLSVTAKNVVVAKTPKAVCDYFSKAIKRNEPVMVLGYGSNTLFTENFLGTVILNRIGGIITGETDESYLLHVGAGVSWHKLVEKTIARGQYGLENLALIPGSVGSAPIQNIGAYGVEFKQFVDYVDIVELATGTIITIKDGKYGYRDSIFKHQYRNGYAIVRVGLRLAKAWQPNLSYGVLKSLHRDKRTARDIFDFVCSIRQQKLPDPVIVGNGGSFFKNPLVHADLADKIRDDYPDIPIYLQPNGKVKLAAGWLIEKCGLKGYQLGGAAVHKEQALVIINKRNAAPNDIVKLASFVRQKVAEQFQVFLEPEIRFIGAEGEIDATKLLVDVAREDQSCGT